MRYILIIGALSTVIFLMFYESILGYKYNSSPVAMVEVDNQKNASMIKISEDKDTFSIDYRMGNEAITLPERILCSVTTENNVGRITCTSTVDHKEFTDKLTDRLWSCSGLYPFGSAYDTSNPKSTLAFNQDYTYSLYHPALPKSDSIWAAKPITLNGDWHVAPFSNEIIITPASISGTLIKASNATFNDAPKYLKPTKKLTFNKLTPTVIHGTYTEVIEGHSIRSHNFSCSLI